MRFHSQRFQTSIFAACIIQFLLISVPLSVCTSPWQMPHTLDVSNTLGTYAIFVCNILRHILIDSYSLQLQSATVCTPTHRSALLSIILTSISCDLAILAILQWSAMKFYFVFSWWLRILTTLKITFIGHLCFCFWELSVLFHIPFIMGLFSCSGFSALYIPDSHPLSDVNLVKTIFPFFFFAIMIALFAIQKCFSFMWFHLTIFVLMDVI